MAVVLGVGYAIATTPGVALASPASSTGSAASTGAAAGDAATKPKHHDTTNASATPHDTADRDAAGATEDAADDDSPKPETTSATSDLDDRDAAGATGHHGSRAATRTSHAQPSTPADTADDPDDARIARQLTAPAESDHRSAAPAQISAPSLSTFASPAVAVVPTAAPQRDVVLDEPHTTLVGLAAHVVDAVLEPLLAPFAPGPTSLAWTMLAFARDEFRRMADPHVAADPATPSLVAAPNLLVNPGAEAGDPSLSGYSTVSVPGWAVTGTPTVIEYGTQRRFPWPTASPGPVLPGLLAFPGRGSGAQFFGGGPVADSTLTQTVDLAGAADAIDRRAGGVQYQLSGDLGGFLIDPSRAKVTVDFLDADGATLSTGALRPVTAIDRWFMTDLIHRDTVGRIPVGARTARVTVTFDDRNPVLGNYNNAYADNLSFTVDADGLAAAPLAPPTSLVGPLDHIFMVYLENKGVRQIVGSPNAPYLNQLLDQYGYASNYYGLTHPSDPNYTPVIGGTDFGFNYNCPSNCFPAGTPNLADTIEEAGLRWAGYAEGGGGYTTPTDRLPFLAFADIYDDPQRVATHLFDISRLGPDLVDPTTAPNFVWFAADDAVNMEGPTDFPVGILHWVLGFLDPRHQYNVAAGDQWLRGPLTTIFDSPTWQDPTQRSAVVVTFDEDYNNLSTGVGNEGNHIVTIVIPSQGAVAAGMRDGHFVADDDYNHYSLLRTIEDALQLPRLTDNDAYADPMNEFWQV
jgi:hypothetical protein